MKFSGEASSDKGSIFIYSCSQTLKTIDFKRLLRLCRTKTLRNLSSNFSLSGEIVLKPYAYGMLFPKRFVHSGHKTRNCLPYPYRIITTAHFDAIYKLVSQ